MRFFLVLIAALASASVVLPAQYPFAELRLASQSNHPTAYLGIAIVDMDANRVARLQLPEERGVEVAEVQDGTPAASAGLKPGDILLTYNGEKILGAQQFVRLLRETPVGRKVRLSIWRHSKEQTLTITTGAAPSSAPIQHADDLADHMQTMQEMSDRVSSLSGLSPMPPVQTAAEIPMVILAWSNLALGLECEPIGAQLAQYFGVKEGVLIRSVGKGTAAEKAGIRAGDVLTSVGDRPLRTPDDFRRSLRIGTKPLSITLTRDRKQLLTIVPPLSDRDQ